MINIQDNKMNDLMDDFLNNPLIKEFFEALYTCSNPNCDCGILEMNLSKDDGIIVTYHVNVYKKTVECSINGERPDNAEKLEQDFLANAFANKADGWKRFLFIYNIKKRQIAESAPLEDNFFLFNINEIENEGILTDYTEVFPFDEELTIVFNGQEFSIYDLHCLNSQCHCHDCHLLFVGAEDEIAFSVDYKTRHWEYSEFNESTLIPPEIAKMLSETAYPSIYEMLEARHQKLRDFYVLMRKEAKQTLSAVKRLTSQKSNKKKRKKNKKNRKN